MVEPIKTKRLTITEVECERDDSYGLYPRTVFIAFLRRLDITKPVCIVTLFGSYVEWIEVDVDLRRQKIATEMLEAIEKKYGKLILDPVTTEGENFCEYYIPSRE